MIRGKKRENWRASFAFIFLEDVPCVNNIAIEASNNCIYNCHRMCIIIHIV